MPEDTEGETNFERDAVGITFEEPDKIKSFLSASIENSANSIEKGKSPEDFTQEELERFVRSGAWPHELATGVDGDGTLLEEIEVHLSSSYDESFGPWVELECMLSLSEEAVEKGWGYLGSKKAELAALFTLRGLEFRVADHEERDEFDADFIIQGPRSQVGISFGPLYKNFEEFLERYPGFSSLEEEYAASVLSIYAY